MAEPSRLSLPSRSSGRPPCAEINSHSCWRQSPRPSPSLSAWAAALHQPRGPSVAPAPSEHLKVQPEDGVDEDADAADKDVRAVRRRDSPVRPDSLVRWLPSRSAPLRQPWCTTSPWPASTCSAHCTEPRPNSNYRLRCLDERGFALLTGRWRTSTTSPPAPASSATSSKPDSVSPISNTADSPEVGEITSMYCYLAWATVGRRAGIDRWVGRIGDRIIMHSPNR